MTNLVEIAKLISVVLGAAILGNWFLSEVKNSRRRNLPWYSAYLSPPGLLILAALLVPVIYWLARH
jgi:hypothetical protein